MCRHHQRCRRHRHHCRHCRHRRRRRDEKPLHAVTLSPFKLAKTETTWWQYNLFCEATGKDKPALPGWGCDANNPVVNVSWYDAVEYANWLSKRDGRDSAIIQSGNTYTLSPKSGSYRFPTEAEWEYAARAGNETEYAGSDDPKAVAWFNENSGSRTRPVSGKMANAFGLHDMSGNVWEWCWDSYGSNYYEQLRTSPEKNPRGPAEGNSRVLRGGSWYYNDNHCRVSCRDFIGPRYRNDFIGFRVAQDQ